MKYTWEADDIKPGRLIDTHNRSERMLIGYWYPQDLGANGGLVRLSLVSLRDGNTTTLGYRDTGNHKLGADYLTKESMATLLNQMGARPVDIREPDMLPVSQLTK